MNLVVMIPAYNEEASIGNVIKKIPRRIEAVDRVKVLVIDDGSTDRTRELAMRCGADRVVNHKVNKGLGAAFETGLDAALEMDADVIVNIDADGQYDPEEIPKITGPILRGEADLVLGWRDVDRLQFMPLGKRLGNKLMSWVTRRLSGLPIIDAQTGFRAFSREAAMRLNLLGGNTYVHETIIQARAKGLRIEQVPVKFRERKGKSRLISNVFSYGKNAAGTILRTYRDYNPLKTFAILGSIFIVAGLVFGLKVLVHFFSTGMVTPYVPSAVLTAILLIMGFQIVIFGLLADMMKGQRKLLERLLYNLRNERRDNAIREEKE